MLREIYSASRIWLLQVDLHSIALCIHHLIFFSTTSIKFVLEVQLFGQRLYTQIILLAVTKWSICILYYFAFPKSITMISIIKAVWSNILQSPSVFRLQNMFIIPKEQCTYSIALFISLDSLLLPSHPLFFIGISPNWFLSPWILLLWLFPGYVNGNR